MTVAWNCSCEGGRTCRLLLFQEFVYRFDQSLPTNFLLSAMDNTCLLLRRSTLWREHWQRTQTASYFFLSGEKTQNRMEGHLFLSVCLCFTGSSCRSFVYIPRIIHSIIVSNVGGEDKCCPLHSEGSLSASFDRIGKRILGRAGVELFPSQRGMHRDEETGVGSARSVMTALLFFLLNNLGCKGSLADRPLPVFGKTRINSSRSCVASSATLWSCLFSRERKTSLPTPLPPFQELLLQGVALRLMTGVDLIYCLMVVVFCVLSGSGGRD